MREPEFWNSATPAARTCAALLSPIGSVYGLSVRLRESRGRLYRPQARVICVGNLTAGGSGKTPVAMAIASFLAPLGKTVFLTRGYGGRLHGPVVVDPSRHSVRDTGDEALLLAQCETTIVARNRAAGSQLADHAGADFIVMDDGFQNFSITKDFSAVVVDAETGLGNGKLIPAGPLREAVLPGFARADAIILVGNGTPQLPPFHGPILRASLIPDTPERFRGCRIMAFAGIGRPQKFFRMLASCGAVLAGTEAFPDHHIFTGAEIAGLKNRASQAGALLVTTSKDYVRLDLSSRSAIIPVPVNAVFDDPAALHALLDRFADQNEDARNGC